MRVKQLPEFDLADDLFKEEDSFRELVFETVETFGGSLHYKLRTQPGGLLI